MNLICGINPVLEALSAGTRHFDRLLVVKGLRNQRVSEAMARATQMGVPLRFEARETLDRMAGGHASPGRDRRRLAEARHARRRPAARGPRAGARRRPRRRRGSAQPGRDPALGRGGRRRRRAASGPAQRRAFRDRGARLCRRPRAREGRAHRQRGPGHRDAQGAGILGRRLRRRRDASAGTPSTTSGPSPLVLGGEGKGIRRLVRSGATTSSRCPSSATSSSLNVSVAAGIALYEIVRQRGVVPSHVKPIPPAPASALEADDRSGARRRRARSRPRTSTPRRTAIVICTTTRPSLPEDDESVTVDRDPRGSGAGRDRP